MPIPSRVNTKLLKHDFEQFFNRRAAHLLRFLKLWARFHVLCFIFFGVRRWYFGVSHVSIKTVKFGASFCTAHCNSTFNWCFQLNGIAYCRIFFSHVRKLGCFRAFGNYTWDFGWPKIFKTTGLTIISEKERTIRGGQYLLISKIFYRELFFGNYQ